MRLDSLRLRNFKGIRSFDLDLDGANAQVFGGNATGKTTLLDAFLWLLFDKDSQGRASFEVKTLDSSGGPVHGLEHEVEGILDLDGEKLTLRKVYSEKWTKKRGSAEAVFSGHTTDYYIDGVPVKKTEYDARIKELCDENAFRLLTDCRAFNEQLHWQERRKLLLEMCGDVSDKDVVASEKKLAPLASVLGKRTLDDHRKVLQAKRTEINRELERTPIRIDEATRSLPELLNTGKDKLNAVVESLRKNRQKKQQELVSLESGGEVAEKTRELREVESEMLVLQSAHRRNLDEALRDKRSELHRMEDELAKAESAVKTLTFRINDNGNRIKRLNERAETMRENWYEIDATKFGFKQSDTCPTCGQALPKEQLREAREKALAEFNRSKAERLEAITQEGKDGAEEIESLKAENKTMSGDIDTIQSKVSELAAKIDALRSEIQTVEAQADDVTQTPEYTSKIKSKESLLNKIAELKTGNVAAMDEVKAEIATIETDLRQFEADIASIEQHAKGQARIEELKKQERELAAEYERLEEELFLTEEFIRAKVRLLEERINDRFQLARFKLFDAQINGAISETCVTTVGGVPYPDLNNAAKIAVGLDVIRSLQDHYGLQAPVWIDNAEAITEIPAMDCQLITLYVSGEDKTLRVETEATNRNRKREVA